MLSDELDLLYRETWKVASLAERRELAGAANLGAGADPSEAFSAIPRATRPMPPMFSRLLWPELEPEEVTRTELGDVPLSEPVAHALQLAFAHELGERIDRAIARLGGGELEAISQGKLEAAADAEGVHWQVLSYALSRESEAGTNN
jgi:hypothetical protein